VYISPNSTFSAYVNKTQKPLG